LLAEFQGSVHRGRLPQQALGYQDRLMPLHQALFVGLIRPASNRAVGARRIDDEVRLPLVKTTESTRGQIRAAMVHAGLIN